MSSSNAFQCRPRLLMRQASRCSRLARSNCGNYASGTPMTRPSDNATQKSSSWKRTAVGLIKEIPLRPLGARPWFAPAKQLTLKFLVLG